MPEEIEIPTEHLHEQVHEAAEHAHETWIRWSALLSAVFAVLAALASLESAHYANDAMIAQIQASDQWGYYQAKGIKGMLIESEQSILKQMDKPVADTEQKIQKYHDEQQEAKTKATELVANSEGLLQKHEILSRAVTLFQISIALVAIALLTKRKRFVLVSSALALGGLWFLVQGLWIG